MDIIIGIIIFCALIYFLFLAYYLIRVFILNINKSVEENNKFGVWMAFGFGIIFLLMVLGIL